MTGVLADLQARADQPPLRPRAPLFAGDSASPFGSIEPELAQRLAALGLPVAPRRDGWRVDGAGLNAELARIAQTLRAHGLAGAWRDELLSVTDASGHVIGAIERAAVRPLGIATRAVHLVGWAEQGGVWVQQRAFDKATDPGLWDTLMGGLVSADESLADTLRRETWEEAGLHIDALRDVSARGLLTVRRPVASGYMVEHIHFHDAVVPQDLLPSNQDGEVAAFECLSLDALQARLAEGVFTLEAALILLQSLAVHPTALRKRG